MKINGNVIDLEADDILREETERISSDDVRYVAAESERIESRFRRAGPLRRFLGDARLVTAMIKDYLAGTYRRPPFRTMAASAAALLYVLNPLDLLPDFLPMVGLLDDVLVFAACLSMIKGDLEDYKVWRSIHRSSS